MFAAELPSDLAASHNLLHALLEVSLPGIILFRPVYAAEDAATVLDLTYVYLNPAAQQMLRLPAQPPEMLLTRYPHSLSTGIFAFCRDTFLSGQSGEYAVNYPYDGLNNFFRLSARRCGELLVVGFTDTAAQGRRQARAKPWNRPPTPRARFSGSAFTTS
jgi:PAS domain-containing protein